MQFESRTYWHPKDVDFPREYEDSFSVGEHGVVAIADGVSSAIFSRQWADILTRAVTEGVPDLADGETFQSWLVDVRRDWSDAIDFSKLSFFQRGKLQQAGGAYSTLLWLEFFPSAEVALHQDDGANASDEVAYRCYAIGDCCFFHVRDGELLRKFPLETVAQFEEDPITICSVNRNRDHMLEFDMVDDTCCRGDLLILASDALAKWWYQRLANEEPIDWKALWEMSSEDWSERVSELRSLPQEQRTYQSLAEVFQALGIGRGVSIALGGSIGLVLLGMCVGLMVALVEDLLRAAWIRFTSGQHEGQTRTLDPQKKAITLGRNEHADICILRDAQIAANHAQFVYEGGGFAIQSVDGSVRVDRAGKNVLQLSAGEQGRLESGDLISVGSTRALFQTGTDDK